MIGERVHVIDISYTTGIINVIVMFSMSQDVIGGGK